MAANPRSFAFTLIHGTSARRSAWTKDESAFRTRLARECNAAINFARVEWAGRNRAGDRRGGADLLWKSLHERFQTCGAWLRATWLTRGIAMAMFVVLMARFALGGLSLLEPPGALPDGLLDPAAGLLAVLVFTVPAFAGGLRPIVDDGPLIAAVSEMAFPAAHRVVVTLATPVLYLCAFLSGLLALSIVNGFIFRFRGISIHFPASAEN